MKKIKYALAGFGGIAENRIAKEGFACDRQRFSPLPNAELKGAFDLSPARRSVVEGMGLKWYASLEDLLADEEVDAVFVATNNLSHAEIAGRALEAGKHVIVEKPIATTVQDAEKLTRLAEEKKLSLAVDHMMTENVFNIKAREMTADGTLGTVNDCCFHMEFSYGSVPGEATTWRCSRREELGGPIGDVGSHCMYMAEFILNSRITEVACVYYPKTMDIKVEDGAYIKFKTESGVSGSVKAAFCEARGGLGGTLSNLGYEIYGDKAVLRGYGTMFQLSGYDDEPVKVRLELDSFKNTENVDAGKPENIYSGVIVKHAQSIINSSPAYGKDAVRNLRLIEAAHESARDGGKTIKVK